MGGRRVGVGDTFGRLTVIGRDVSAGKWTCRCECGETRAVEGFSLNSGETRSCGCLRRDMMAQKMFKHGLIAHPLYDVWSQMKSRCENPNNKNYPGWGGRGIRVYSEWHEFKPFFEWAISNGYESGLTIDRRDNDGDYEPSNCRFVTTLVQNNNRRPRWWKKRPAFFTEPTYASN